jgi:hypothetical protein
MKKFVLVIALMLLGCSSKEITMVGDYEHNGPNDQKAKITINGEHGELNVQFQKGSTRPAINEKLIVTEIIDGYELKLLSNNVKLKLLHTDAFKNRYVCTDCVGYENNILPVIWFKNE